MSTPTVADTVAINDASARIEHVHADGTLVVVTLYGDRFALAPGELSLSQPAEGPRPAVWRCWTDIDGRRA